MSAQDYELLGITAQTIAYVYAWGMGAVLVPWSLGYAVGAAIDMIRKA